MHMLFVRGCVKALQMPSLGTYFGVHSYTTLTPHAVVVYVYVPLDTTHVHNTRPQSTLSEQ